ncbi:MAG: magnesium chelatase ATPase subunit D [Acidobacteriota bacterium]
MQNPDFPFAAIVGNEQAKLALILLAIDRRLKGVLISAPFGSGKSLLARTARMIFADSISQRLPFIEIPNGVTEDRLLGGLDFERTLKTGKKIFSKGLLAQADSGILYADDAAMLEAKVIDKIAAALDTQAVNVERDGLSLATAASFVFIGAYCAQERAVSSLLRERVGLIVETDGGNSFDERLEITKRVLHFEKTAKHFTGEFKDEMRALRRQITQAKKLLPEISLSREGIERLSAAALRLGIAGNQADIFASRAAMAHAALKNRQSVNDEDLIAAIQLVLLPRARRLPDFDERLEQSNSDSENQSIGEQNLNGLEQTLAQNHRDSPSNSQNSAGSNPIENLIIQAMDAFLPKDFLAALSTNQQQPIRRQKATTGKRGEKNNLMRGRSNRAFAKKTPTKKIAVAATIRAAAAWQKRRAEVEKTAANAKIKITAADLRFKRFKQKSGILFIFAVDASGSMALNRLAQAKGAMTHLLQEAYIHRDKVAMLTFRGNQADVVLPPTRSVELAKRAVDAIPTGGSTPLAAALIKAIEVAGQAHSQEISQAVLLLFTDGRANIGLGKRNEKSKNSSALLQEELGQLGLLLKETFITSVVIDTRANYLANNDGRNLAATLAAQYIYLPRAEGRHIYENISSFTNRLRQVETLG